MMNSVGMVDEADLESLTFSGGEDPTPYSFTPTVSSMPCLEGASIIITAISETVNTATQFFSCGHYC